MLVRLFVLLSAVTAPSMGLGDFDYPDFSSPDDLHFVANATVNGVLLELTENAGGQRGAVYYDQQVSINSPFSTTFQIQILGGPAGADGMAFIMQRDSLDAIGGYGNGQGYALHDISGELGIPYSVAVEFDTYANGASADPDGNHISVNTRGPLPNDSHTDYSLGLTSLVADLQSGTVYDVTIDYIPGALTIYFDGAVTPTLEVSVDLADTIDGSTAWIGFTAATGGSSNAHHVLSWSFSGSISPDFERGDANDDGTVDVSDPVFTLAALFIVGSNAPRCLDAADTNDDGAVDISDAVYTLAALFILGSPQPPPPTGLCGSDPTADGLGCAQSLCP